MILYRPTDGDAYDRKIEYLPRHCFIMTQMSDETPAHVMKVVRRIRTTTINIFKSHSIECIDAASEVTGRDFLEKIWSMIIKVPIGVGIIHEGMTSSTMSNIFYEIGLLDALGKETVVIKTKAMGIPSDHNRTEYIEYGRGFNQKLLFFANNIFKRADHYEYMAEISEHSDPLLSVDYLRRAFLITGNIELSVRAKEIYKNAKKEDRAKNCVESLLVDGW